MEFENKIEINRHKIIQERGSRFAEVLEGEEKQSVLDIIRRSKKYLNEIGYKHNVVLNPDGMDWKTFKVSTKRYIRTDFIEPAQQRLKNVSDDLRDIDGICEKCLRNRKEFECGNYNLCDKCREKWDIRWGVWCCQWDRSRNIEKDFYDAFEKTEFPKELIGNWMLLMKEMRKDKDSKHIDNALKDAIRYELMAEFRNQNKQLIKKYEL